MQPPSSADRAVELTVRSVGAGVVIAVGGDLDLDNLAPLSLALGEAERGTARVVVVDLSGVTFADSSTVNVLLRARSRLGDRFRVAALSPFVRRVFDVIGLERAVAVHATVDAALAAGEEGDGTRGAPGSAVPGGE